MARHLTIIGTLTIASGESESGWLTFKKVGFGQATDMILYGPAALTNTVTVEVSHKEVPSGGDARELSVQGAPLTVAAGAAEIIPSSAFASLRVNSSGNEGAARVFTLMAQVEM